MAAAFVYAPVCRYDFVSLEDPRVTTQNPLLGPQPLHLKIASLFASPSPSSWKPLPMAMHAVIYRIVGGRAGWHHIANLTLHAVNMILFFWLLHRMTGRMGRSALAALFFGLHPVNVEAVAWVSQMRVLLSCFWLLGAALIHLHYQRISPGRTLLAVLACAFLGILSGPEALLLPLALLILDRAGRCAGEEKPWRIREKWPLFALSLAGAVFFLLPVFREPAIRPAGLTLKAVLVTCLEYFREFLWPSGLTVHHPFPGSISLWAADGAAAALAGLCFLAWRRKGGNPVLAAGWFWFLCSTGVLTSLSYFTSGPYLADRMAYAPSLGIAAAAAWLIPAPAARSRERRNVFILGALVLASLYAAAAAAQMDAWKNSKRLFVRNLAIHAHNPLAHTGLGNWLMENGLPGLAETNYKMALEKNPGYVPARLSLGAAMARRGGWGQAAAQFQMVLGQEAGNIQALNQLGKTLLHMGKTGEALEWLEKAVRNAPGLEITRLNYATALAASGRPDLAAAQYREALRIRPDFGEAREGLAIALTAMGRFGEALMLLEQNLRSGFDEADARLGMGAIYMEMGNPASAEPQFRQALAARPDFAEAHNNLGAALLLMGKTEEAVEHFTTALAINPGLENARANLERARALDLNPESP